MKVQLKAAQALFLALGLNNAPKYTVEQCNKKMSELLKVIHDPEEVDPNALSAAEDKALLKKLRKAAAADEPVEVVANDAADEPVEAPAAKPTKASKEKPTAKKEAEKPTKKVAEKAPAKKEPKLPAHRDKFGSREGSGGSKINAVLTRMPQTTDEITEASGVLKATVQEHLWKLRKVLKVADRNEKGWYLLPTKK